MHQSDGDRKRGIGRARSANAGETGPRTTPGDRGPGRPGPPGTACGYERARICRSGAWQGRGSPSFVRAFGVRSRRRRVEDASRGQQPSIIRARSRTVSAARARRSPRGSAPVEPGLSGVPNDVDPIQDVSCARHLRAVRAREGGVRVAARVRGRSVGDSDHVDFDECAMLESAGSTAPRSGTSTWSTGRPPHAASPAATSTREEWSSTIGTLAPYEATCPDLPVDG